MSLRLRVSAFAAVVVIVATSATGYAVHEQRRGERQRATAPDVPVASVADISARPHIVFRHTGRDSRFGTVAEVALDDPGGPRAFTGVACDRVDSVGPASSCLATERGVVTGYRVRRLAADFSTTATGPLSGIPSRTRLSPDGSLTATTVFVSGHSYLTAGFSTATVVTRSDGSGYGNLERFRLIVDGRETRPTDRNVWGVTFVDDRTFYATVGTGGRTYLVRGDLEQRTLTSVTDNAECPSLSPDQTRVAFKVDVAPGADKRWRLAVYDLRTGQRTLLSAATTGLDDQAEWLDDDTVLYARPRKDSPSTTDVWAVDTDPAAQPRLLIEDAWSPAVVRG